MPSNQSSLRTFQVQIPASRKSPLPLSHLSASLSSFTKTRAGEQQTLDGNIPITLRPRLVLPYLHVLATWHSTVQPGELPSQRIHRVETCKNLPLPQVWRRKLMVTSTSTNSPVAPVLCRRITVGDTKCKASDLDSLRVFRALFCHQVSITLLYNSFSSMASCDGGKEGRVVLGEELKEGGTGREEKETS